MPLSQSAATDVATRLGVSTVCFRHDDLATALEEIASLGIGAVDLAALRGLCEHVDPNANAAKLYQAARAVKDSGIIPLAVNADPESFDEQDPVVVLDRIARLVEFCAEVDCPVLILPCGSNAGRGKADAALIDGLAEGLLRAAGLGDAVGVTVSVEAPHYHRVCSDLPLTDQLMSRLQGRVPLVFDTSHVRASGANPAEAFAARSDIVNHVQLRDAVTGDIRRAIGHGAIDFGAFLDATESAGYTGYYVLELETHNSPYDSKRAEVTAGLDLMRRLSAARAGS
jgi:sugar phosphate isomerase/epimerase